jgi:hypothetical protein
MIVVTVYDYKIDRIYEIVKELREIGWRQGQDFDFYYRPPTYDAGGGWCLSMTDFKFYNDELATFFKLRWA